MGNNIVKNILSLGLLQILTSLLPLFYIPYLTRVLGVEQYGGLAFTQIVASYWLIFLEYGFGWSATRRISMHRHNRNKVEWTLVNIWGAQSAFATVCIVVAFLMAFAAPNRSTLYIWAATYSILSITFPSWIFIGLEEAKTVAAIQIFSRLASLPPLFILVKGPEDLNAALAIQCLSPLIATCAAIFILGRRGYIRLAHLSIAGIVQVLIEGWEIFRTRLSISLYTTATPVLLGLIATSSEIAGFALADKIRTATQSMLAPISQAIFPRMSVLYASSPNHARGLLQSTLLFTVTCSAILAALTYIFSEKIMQAAGGVAFIPSASILQIFALVYVPLSISNGIGVQVFLASGQSIIVHRTSLAVGCLSIMLAYPLIKTYSGIGAAALVLAAEITVSITFLIIYVYRKPELADKSINQ